MNDVHPPVRIIEYLVQELSIGDMEDEAARLKQEMERAPKGGPDETRLFQELVALQEKLVQAQKSRRPLV